MKRNLVVVFAALFFIKSAQAQKESIFYLAKNLDSIRGDDPSARIPLTDKVKAALEREVYQDSTVTLEVLNRNPYLKGLFEAPVGAGASNIPKTLINNISGLNVTKYANAIADIMIERAKQELTIAFFNRFIKVAEKYPEFQTLFPITYNTLSNLLSYAYPQMINKLREGFFDDIEQIPFHIEALLELPRYRTLLEGFPEIRLVIRSIRLVHQLETGDSNADDIIQELSGFEDWNTGSVELHNVGSTVKFMALLSEGLRYRDTTRIWVTGKEIKGFIRDTTFTKIFLGLLWQKIKQTGITYELKNGSVNLHDLLAKQKDNILLVQNKISQFISIADRANESFADIKKKNKDQIKLTHEDYFNYINVSIDVIDFSFSIVKLFDEELRHENYLAIARESNNLYKHVYTKEYTQAITSAWDIITRIQELTKKDKNSAAKTKSVVNGALDHETASDKLLTFIEKVKPFALFIANMADAKDENEVKAALENAILPVGSSSIKKYSKNNVSVQTYLGAFFTPNPASNGINGTWSDKFGVTAPIGISWTPISLKKGGAFSLFGSFFDIGAIVDYKLKKEPNPTTPAPGDSVINKDYKIELGQIFSPGLYVVYGCAGNLPISLGFGGQYGPGLSKIKADPVLTNPRWRWNFFLAVDLPFFNIANSSKKHKSKNNN